MKKGQRPSLTRIGNYCTGAQRDQVFL